MMMGKMATREEVEETIIEVLISHEPTQDPHGALREAERVYEGATGVRDTAQFRELVNELVRRGFIHREPVVTHGLSTDDQRWHWTR